MIEITNLFGVSVEEPDHFNIYLDLFLQISSKIKDKVCLRGNILLNALIPEYARATKDIDIDVLGEEVFYSDIVPELTGFAERLIQRDLADAYSFEDLRETGKAGIKITKCDKIVFKVDINISSPVLYGYIEYDVKGRKINGSCIEKVLVDKMSVLLTRVRFRRYKDAFDVNAILSSGITFDVNKLYLMLEETHGKAKLSEMLFDPDNFSYDTITHLEKIHQGFKATSFIKDITQLPEFGEFYSKIFNLIRELQRRV